MFPGWKKKKKGLVQPSLCVKGKKKIIERLMIFPNHIAFKSPNLVGQMSSQILNLAIVVLSDYQCNEEMHTIIYVHYLKMRILFCLIRLLPNFIFIEFQMSEHELLNTNLLNVYP